MARQSNAERNRKQRDRQRALRAKQMIERRPGRDDVARVMLHWFILGATAMGREKELEETTDVIVRRLVKQGFDKRASYDVFKRLIEKYTEEKWDFQHKQRLLHPEQQGDASLK